MGAGALSDPRVVEASAKVIPILVDCTDSGAHRNLLQTYEIRGFPTLLFVGPEGETLGRPPNREAESLVQLMEQYGSKAGVSSSSWPGLALLVVVAIAVPFALIFIYKKWFAATLDQDS